MSVTPGAIMALFTAPPKSKMTDPKTVQILKMVCTPLPNGKNRHRLIVSDGEHYLNTLMPSKQIVENLIVPGLITKNSIVTITECAFKEVPDKKKPGNTTRLALALNMNVVEKVSEDRIGSPTDITKDENANRRRRNVNSNSSGLSKASSSIAKKSRADSAYDAIRELNPYRNRWTIKARVTTRGDKKTWSNARGEGCLFSADLLDSEGTEIRATFWKDAVDLFYDKLAAGTVATFSGGRLKEANKQWTSIKNDYEITFDTSATITVVEDDDESIEQMHFDFVKLADIENLPEKSNCDIIAVVKDFQPVSQLMSKKGRELFKRDMTVVDKSGVAVRLTLWGTEAQKTDDNFANNPVICVKGARVSDFNGKTLSSGFSSVVFYNDNSIPDTAALNKWWSADGHSAATKTLSAAGGGGRGISFAKRKGVASIQQEGLGHKEKPDWIDCKVIVGFIKHDTTYCYPACPEEGNNKKLIEQGDGWLCEANGKTYDQPEYRYILTCNVVDHTGSAWVTSFNKEAIEVMGGVTAGELKHAQTTNEAEFEAYFSKALFQDLIVTLRCKAEVYKDETRVRTNLQRLSKVNYAAESRCMIDALNAME